MPALSFKPGDRVTVFYDIGDDINRRDGFFVAMDDTGLMVQKRGTGKAPDYLFFPRERVVMIEQARGDAA